jgi:hypothetical protein
MVTVGLLKDPTVLAGALAVNAVLEEAGYCWLCSEDTERCGGGFGVHHQRVWSM